jgi:hypothetical protein
LTRSNIAQLLAGVACTALVGGVAAALVHQLAQSPGHRSPAPATAAAASNHEAPCGFRSGPRVPIRHVIWIWFANQTRSAVLGSPAVPFVNVIAAECGVALRYTSLGQPSLVDYLGAITGRVPAFRRPCPHACVVRAPTLLDEVGSWRAYYGGMTAPCQRRNNALYVRTHNAATFVPRLGRECLHDDLPLGTAPGTSALIDSARAGTLPAFTMVVPDQCHNMHFDPQCPLKHRHSRSAFLGAGDKWLGRWLRPLVRSAGYRDGSTAIFITWDEGSPESPHGLRCSLRSHLKGCQVPLIVLSPYTRPGTATRRPGSHFALLKTTEQLLGVPLRGAAFSGSTRNLGSKFGLG